MEEIKRNASKTREAGVKGLLAGQMAGNETMPLLGMFVLWMTMAGTVLLGPAPLPLGALVASQLPA
jgi:hypothetical protein